MKILGIDPGLGITGYGLIEAAGGNIKLLEAGVIRTSSGGGIADRLLKIYDGLSEIIEEYRPDALVLEKIYSHYKHPATAILMGHARGAVCLLCGKYNLQLVNYASTHVKKSIAGRGRASKAQVGGMVKTLLSLKKIPQPEDVSDALALAISHVRSLHDFKNIRKA
ncbi:MAG: crossover junction endodeoxyribonuclease RuvC [Candidatus Omnitrophota bacterium]|nr:crossover junction endodeoxyribonuclease RuvC [Candidatus Omnitrophota bacterium]